MHLLPGQLMFGVAPVLLIDCARQIHEGDYNDKKHTFDIDAFSRALGAPVRESGPVLQAMLADGFFERAEGRVIVTLRPANSDSSPWPVFRTASAGTKQTYCWPRSPRRQRVSMRGQTPTNTGSTASWYLVPGLLTSHIWATWTSAWR